MSQNYPLIVWSQNDPLLVCYNVMCRDRALGARAHYTGPRDVATTRIWDECARHEDLLAQIDDIKGRIRLLTQGVPQTETLDRKHALAGSVQNEDAEGMVLKKAWREVCKTAHPDKGGDTKDFQALKAAYEAGDLGSLTEWVITSHKTLIEQIEYWRTEEQKPARDWSVLQRMDQFKILRALMTGQTALAHELSRALMRARLFEVQIEFQILISKFDPEKLDPRLRQEVQFPDGTT